MLHFRNKKTKTEYVSCEIISGTRLAEVVTKAGSKYLVKSDSVETFEPES